MTSTEMPATEVVKKMIHDWAGEEFVPREEMAKLMEDIGMTPGDINALFDHVDDGGSGKVHCGRLLDWIFESAGEEGEGCKAGNTVEVDLLGKKEITYYINAEELAAIMVELHRSPSLAPEVFQAVRKRLQQPEGVSKLPLLEFLTECGVDRKVEKQVNAFKEAAAAVRRRLRQDGTLAPPPEVLAELERQDLDTCINETLRILAATGRPAQDAYAVYEEGLLTIPKVGRELLQTFATKKDELIKLVREAKHNPPLLPCGLGQLPNKERCMQEVEAIIKECREKGQKFTDPTWDMTKVPNEVLYVDKKGPGYDCTVGKPAGYKRLTEIYKDPVIFEDGVKPNDIYQGSIGTCFLLGAIGAVAGVPDDAIAKLFITWNIELGIYAVRLNADGMWTYVIIDDWMPVNKKGQLLFSKCAGKEIWCPLLEKAYCKFHTCYEMCDGGSATIAIFTFWGGGNGKLPVEEVHKANPSKFFPFLKDALGRGWLLTNTFSKQKSAKGVGACGEAVLDCGLVAGHCYSILKVVEADGNQLVCVRNPWGAGEWTGKWSDKNAFNEWTPQMVAATGWVPENDGTFYMSIEDFVSLVSVVSYARTFPGHYRHVTHYGKFKSTCTTGKALWAFNTTRKGELALKKGETVHIEGSQKGWWKGHTDGGTVTGLFPWNYIKLDEQPVACFELDGFSPVDEPMLVFVQLVQPRPHRKRMYYKRESDGLNYKNLKYEELQLLVVDKGGKVCLNMTNAGEILSGELELPAAETKGNWKIYAISVGGCGCSFYLRCYIKGCPSATLKEIPAKMDDISALLVA